jgi:hypothetical protein
VSFNPDVASAAMSPVAIYPMGMRVWGLLVNAGDPDIAVAIPAMIAVMPGPITMLGRRRRDDFMRAFGWWTEADDDL